MLFPADRRRTAQKRVQRILDRARRIGIPVDNPDKALALLQRNHGMIKKSKQNIQMSNRRRSIKDEDLAVSANCLVLKRLGRREKIVLKALQVLGGRARFSAIVREVLEMLGLDPLNKSLAEGWKNRVWQALKRLQARGIVDSYAGIYWLKSNIMETHLFIENFRARNKWGDVVQIWSKKSTGKAIELSQALTLASLLEARKTIQVEIALPVNDQSLLNNFDRLGMSEIRIYKDYHPPYRGRLKIEIVLNHPPLEPSILEQERWIKTFYSFIYELCIRILRLLSSGGL